MKSFCLLLPLCLVAFSGLAQQTETANQEITLSRDSARVFFGTYEFAPNFKLRVFSENNNLFGQREGDAEKFQLFAKAANRFFLKTMPAELEFIRASTGQYETLLLRQEGKTMKAKRIVAQPLELYDTVAELDARLYRAYNERKLPVFAAFFAPDLEFYHDQTGKTDYQENIKRFKENLSRPTIMRRELVPGSLEVYPVAGFGAIEIGTHRFYQTDPGQPEKLVAQPRFMQLWQQRAGGWQIVRVVSYGH